MLKKWQLVLVAVMLVVTGFFAVTKKVHKELPAYGQVPAFEFQDQNGRTFSSSVLSNQIWVAGFIFTRCKGPCPMISAEMAELKKRLHYSSRFSLVSFTVDPEHDTPQVLSEYARSFQRDGKPVWYFLTGAKEKIYELATKTFMQTAAEDSSEKEMNARFMHGTRIALVDGEGKIRGFYDSQEKNIVDNLERDIRAIL